MALVAEDLIDEARDFHEEFSEYRFPNRMLLRTLSRAQQGLYRIVTQLNDNALAATTTFDGVDLHFPIFDGDELDLGQEALIVFGLEVRVGGKWEKVLLLREGNQPASNCRLAAKIVGRKLYLEAYPRAYASDRSEYDLAFPWDDLEELRVSWVPYPAPVEAMEGELVAPDSARPYLIGAMVAFMASRFSTPETRDLKQDAADEMKSVVASLVTAVPLRHFRVVKV